MLQQKDPVQGRVANVVLGWRCAVTEGYDVGQLVRQFFVERRIVEQRRIRFSWSELKVLML